MFPFVSLLVVGFASESNTENLLVVDEYDQFKVPKSTVPTLFTCTRLYLWIPATLSPSTTSMVSCASPAPSSSVLANDIAFGSLYGAYPVRRVERWKQMLEKVVKLICILAYNSYHVNRYCRNNFPFFL